MAAGYGEQPLPLVQEATARIFSGGADASRTTVRLAHFLLPRADASHPPALPPLPPSDFGPVLDDGLEVEFKGWAPESPKLWRRWVAKLRPRHEPLWRSVGILDAILAGPVRAPPQDALRGDVDALEAVRRALYLSKNKNSRPDRTAWARHFLERPPGKVEVGGGGGGGGDEACGRLEHGAFLAMWLSLFVLPAAPFDVVRTEVLPLAARLARGRGVALAPAALASIYSDLSALKRYINLEKRYQAFVVWAPLQIVQLWLWKRFPELRPPETTGTTQPDGHGIPTESQWQNALKVLDPVYVHAVFMSPKKFEWRPYGSSSFALRPEMGGHRVHGQDIAESAELLSFILCLRACELVGMRCIEHYRPQRVARQLSFDQDIPGTLPRVNSNWVAAWETYKMEPKKFVFIVPKYKPAVTIDYVQWWKPYLLGCAAAVVKARKMKELPLLLSPRKRKIDVPPDVSPKRVGNGAKEKAVELSFEAPIGSVSTINELSCASATKIVQGKSFQQASIEEQGKPCQQDKEEAHNLSVTHDRENRSSLHSEVLQNLVVEDATNTGINEALGAMTVADMHSAEVSFDVPVDLVSIVDELPCVSATKEEQGNDCQQDKEEARDLSVTHDKENRSSVVYVHSTPVVAANTGNNKAFGPSPIVDVQSAPEDVVVISDDDNEDEVGGMHQKPPQLETAPSSLEEQNAESQIISASSNPQDSRVMKDVRVQSNCDHETDNVRSNIVLRKESFEVLAVDTVQPGFNLLDTPTGETQTCAVTGQIDKGYMVEKEILAGVEGIENVNEDVSPSFQEINSPVEDCMVANRRMGSGNNYSSGLAHVNTQLINRVVCTRTLYYLRPFWLSKHVQNKDASDTTTDEGTFQPRREVGTPQMIEEAFAARQAQKVELQKVIDRLKEEIVALEVP
uniref:Aminotransferase-like plant mobile domain-containing protein n=1 Tax=Oryza rufipogon TaxID=4529 RepID=A0A0E0NX89_ORYRU